MFKQLMGALILNAFTLGGLYLALTKSGGGPVTIFAAFFAVFGLAVLASAIRDVLDRDKFGRIRLHVESAHPAPGGQLVATLLFFRRHPDLASINVELSCLLPSRRSLIGPFCITRATVHLTPRGNGAIARFSLPIVSLTPDLIERINLYGKPQWTLQVSADLPGIDLHREYPLEIGRLSKGMSRREAAVVAAGFASVAQPSNGETALPATSAGPIPAAERLSSEDKSQGNAIEEPPKLDRGQLIGCTIDNLVPLIGVLVLKWTVSEVLFVYWVECVFIGLFAVASILAAPVKVTITTSNGTKTEAGAGAMLAAKLFSAGFFSAHFGLFCYALLIPISFLFDPDNQREPPRWAMMMLRDPETLISVAVMAVVYVVSFYREILVEQRHLEHDSHRIITDPYARVFATQIFLFAGAFVFINLKSPALLMAAFVVFKTWLDYRLRQRSQR